MQLHSLVALAVLAASGSLAVPAPADLLTKETVIVPRGWVKRGSVDSSRKVTMKLGLARRGIADLQERLQQIADPDHEHYGNWLSLEQTHAYLKPSDVATRAVDDWLASHGVTITKRSDVGDLISFETTYAQARSMLGDAEFSVYESLETREQIVRTSSFKLPRSVHEHIDIVSPSTNFGVPKAQAAPYKFMGEVDPTVPAPHIQPLATGAADPKDCQLKYTTR